MFVYLSANSQVLPPGPGNECGTGYFYCEEAGGCVPEDGSGGDPGAPGLTCEPLPIDGYLPFLAIFGLLSGCYYLGFRKNTI
ncbi:hypothetical protein ACG2LH_02910 [Zhouia sp. PK063]|uniref:hypothetical protein n=1 Tax=Zhouia sp. PK063 TaxID=3373602 RepID=UPI0037A45D2C